jgi:hypothetical protein
MLQTIEFSKYRLEGQNFILNNKIKFSSLNIFAGANGVGKTMAFKAAWFMQFTLQLYKINLLHPSIPISDERFLKDLNVIFRLTWTSSEQVSGAIEVRDDDLNPSSVYRIQVEKGEVQSFDIDVIDKERFKVGQVQQISYNTKDARTFSQYDRYIKLCKKFDFNIMCLDPQNEELKEMGEFYMIYDMLWFEKVRQEIKNYDNGEPENELRLKLWDDKFGNSDKSNNFPTSDQFVFKKETVFVDNLGSLKRFSDYDSGTQSLLMMTLFGI